MHAKILVEPLIYIVFLEYIDAVDKNKLGLTILKYFSYIVI